MENKRFKRASTPRPQSLGKPKSFTKPKGPRKPHDRGKTVYIGNLRYKRDEKGVIYLFAKYGHVKSVEIVTEPGTDKSKGYAFVKMSNSDDAIKAIAALNNQVVDGRTLKVSEALERDKDKRPYSYKAPSFNDGNEKKVEKKKKPSKRKKGLNVLFDYLKA